jgi:S-adenosylmethionine:tRNA ribosyltransferase-isomerase
MIAATQPRARREMAKMLVVHAGENRFHDAVIADLPKTLGTGDLLVVNDAATIPASLMSRGPRGSLIEIRLVRYIKDSDWKAVVMGEGSWRIPTELRDLPEPLHVGDSLHISTDFSAEVLEVATESPRLITLRFSRQGVGMWSGIYAFGRPIQYSYLNDDLRLWSVQTVYASRPWAAEMPSAGYSLTWQTLLDLKRCGISLARLTHAAGLSAAGDESLDKLLPFPERFEIPPSTVEAIELTHRNGGRVIACGTTVVRALEGVHAANGRLVAGTGETDLVIDGSFQLQVVDGLLTGIHDPAQSHFRLLRAFAGERLLRSSWRHAASAGYMCHEFGDVCLIIRNEPQQHASYKTSARNQ